MMVFDLIRKNMPVGLVSNIRFDVSNHRKEGLGVL